MHVPPSAATPPIAQGLGCGKSLSEADMQIRGAGNIFGEQQKGNVGVRDLGADMYLQILQKAMAYLQQKEALGLADSDDDSELLQAAVDETTLLGLDNTLDVTR